jgi:small subunit ribosomal protein S5
MPSSFFCRSTAASVWKSVTSVSAAGKKRGRGKGAGRVIAKDFNRGQQIGVGRHKLLLPGLNTSVFAAKKQVDIQDLGSNDEFHKKLQAVRNEMNTYKKFRELPIERGFSGRRAHGRHAGQPDDHNETSFDGFDSIVLMLRPIQNMTGIMGRTKSIQALVVTGNKNGLAGFATASGKDGRAVVRHARNRAAQSLVYIPRFEDHTVMHDFFSRYYHTTVFVERKPRGHGIEAHRVIKAICEMFGITDLYAKVEGVTKNQINMTKAFFLGLMNQKRYQDIANEKQLHLVDVREENYFYPQILASPEGPVKTDAEIVQRGENLDFTYYIYDGRVKLVEPKRKPFYEDGPTWYKHLDRLDYEKNRERTKLLLAAKYGSAKVLDVFPYFKTNAASFTKDT